jgi:hypothetical protein
MTCPHAAAKYLVEAQSQQAQVYLHILHSHPCSCTKNTLQCIALLASGGNRFILPEGLGQLVFTVSLLTNSTLNAISMSWQPTSSPCTQKGPQLHKIWTNMMSVFTAKIQLIEIHEA